MITKALVKNVWWSECLTHSIKGVELLEKFFKANNLEKLASKYYGFKSKKDRYTLLLSDCSRHDDYKDLSITYDDESFWSISQVESFLQKAWDSIAISDRDLPFLQSQITNNVGDLCVNVSFNKASENVAYFDVEVTDYLTFYRQCCKFKSGGFEFEYFIFDKRFSCVVKKEGSDKLAELIRDRQLSKIKELL